MSKRKFLGKKFLKDSKGVSAVIATVLLIALTMFIVSIVWAIVNNLIEDEISGASACFGVFDKVSLNDRFTCYNSDLDELHFSISVRDIEVDGILVGVSGNGSSISFIIPSEASQVDYLRMYNGSENVFAPGKNSGQTYIFNLTGAGFQDSVPLSIQVAPIIEGVQCETSDSISSFSSCIS